MTDSSTRSSVARIYLAIGIVAIAAAVVPAHAITHITPLTGRNWLGNARAHARHQIFTDLSVWAVLFAIAAAALLRAPRRASVVTSLIGGVVLGVVSMARIAILSNDLYRYAWDGKVQAAGIDPYRYAPDSEHLVRLHDSWLWPTAQVCAGRGKPPGCTLINRETVHTIYPPFAQLYFRIAHLVLPERWRDRGYEALGLAMAITVAILILLALRRAGRDPRLVALWSLCPAVSLEAVQNAHIDTLGIIAIVAALAIGRQHLKTIAVLIGLAGLTKFYPLALFPAIIQQRRKLAAAIIVGMFALAYLPYVIDVGSGVTGYLHGYLSGEGYGSGTRFILLSALDLHGRPASVIAVLIVLTVIVLAFRNRLGSPEQAALAVFATALFVATPGEPWEALLVVALVAVTGAWQWLGLLAGEYVGYLTSILGDRTNDRLVTAYGAALAAGVVLTLWRRRHAVTTP